MRRLHLSLLIVFLAITAKAIAKDVITSPDGRLSVEVQTGADGLGWTVSRDGKVLYTESAVSVTVDGKTLGGNAKAKSVRQRSAAETIRPVVPLKFAEIESHYHEATVSFGNYQLLLRVMNNAVAHRFVLMQRGQVEVEDEQFSILPAIDCVAHYQTAGSFNTSYEEPYQHKSIAEWQSDGSMATVPALISGVGDTQLLIGEADVDDYPRMFLRAADGAITPTFPKAPLTWEPWGDRGERITQEASYIAKTNGQRSLPWRFVVITDSKGIIEQTVPVQLARRSTLTDTGWIQPGKFSWEWWNGATPYGTDVNFRAGCNYDTYCYFADFAAKYSIEYILLDEGWAKSTDDPFHGNDGLRLPELINYCNSKGVKIALWLPWLTVHKNFDTLFKTYAEWGIPAVKIDFMDHADQWMVNFYKRVTAEAAKYHIIVDWHGSFTPAGLEQEYPNLISYEGVLGLEQMGGCRPENTVFIPFIRNAVGPADFTPGGMTNMQPEVYRSERPNSAAMGTRAFQMALYVVLESGIQMLADNPTRYMQNDDCTRFIAAVPTTWDETRALNAKAGEYAVVAKRKGNQWFIGAINNGTPRTLDLHLDFLRQGNWRLTSYSDGSNADYQAMHYIKDVQTVTAGTTLSIRLARNGGWAAVVSAGGTEPLETDNFHKNVGGLAGLVNPFMGTTTLWKPQDLGYARTEERRPWGAETYPGAALPNAMVQLTPVTKYGSGSGYQYEDRQIYGFAHTCKGHWNLLHVPVLPVTAEGNYRPDNYWSTFSHEREEAHPGYYHVYLDRYHVDAELTTTLRCGYHRYTFRPDDERRLLIDITRSNNQPRQYEVKQSGPNTFEGFQDGEGRIYFYAETSEEIAGVEEVGAPQRRNVHPLTIVSFKQPRSTRPLELKMGFSFVSIDNARQNLKAELAGKDFAQVRTEANDTWERLLGHIKVDGGSPAERSMFYSTLYRVFLFPHLRSDVNGEYRDARGDVVKADFRFYTTPSFWDTYRNKLILLGMVTPDVAADIISSCIDQGEKTGGYMPTFFHGDHAATFVAGSWLRGIRGFDLNRAYALMLKSATVPGRGGRPYLDEYLQRGWISEKDTVNVRTENEYKGSVTKTLEYAYDDYATALVARELKDRKNEKLLMSHAQNYRTLFDPSTGFWRGKVLRNGVGQWIDDFRPNYPYYQYMYREADAWNSLFFAPHDPQGMIVLYPSKDAVEQKLDSLFTTPCGGYEAWNLTGYLGTYCHGNQPGHSIPYTYYFIDRQEKAQHVLNTLMHDYYGMGDEKLAYAGMDDAGEMSAWYALNAIGLYTYSPADPEYIVTVPLFPHVSFTLGSGKTFHIVREGKGEHISQITVGGQKINGWMVKHEDLAKGKELKITTYQ